VATFTDPGGAEANDGTHYSASINWGDMTAPTMGTITFGGGVFTVQGGHTYAAAGSYTITCTINHEMTTPQPVTDPATVNKASTSTKLVASANSSFPGQPVNFTATVTPVVPGDVRPTGTVAFYNGAIALGLPVNLSASGVATLGSPVSVSELDGNTIAAVYSGDGNFEGSMASLDPNKFFVIALYRDVLTRPPDDTGLQFWVGQLHAGISRTQVAMDFWLSEEHRGLEVAQFYGTFLVRSADPGGQQYWLRQLETGVPEFQVALGFVTSKEYMDKHSDNADFVMQLYHDLLNRTASPPASQTEMAYWQQLLQNGARRDAVAFSFLSSREAFQKAIDAYYAVFLGRPGHESQQELEGWLVVLETGRATPLSVASAFLASDEYLARALNGAMS
jgi:hypothetical protein